jgi:hypothetical protein
MNLMIIKLEAVHIKDTCRELVLKDLTPNTPDTFFSRKMKLLSILIASIWAVAAAAQGITIGSPPQGQDVSPGQQLTIQVIKNVRGPAYFPSETSGSINKRSGSRTSFNHQ